MTHYVDTIEQFRDLLPALEPVFITSKKHGKIPVPCANTILVARELVVANGYNPNHVPVDRMALLKRSVLDNGFCFPVVTIFDDETEKFIIIDGFHRRTMGDRKWLDFDYVPVVVLSHTMAQRMAATVQFNKARGVHQVDMDADVIRALAAQGLSDEEIANSLGIDLDTVARYKSLAGIADLFKNSDYSPAWHIVEDAEEVRA